MKISDITTAVDFLFKAKITPLLRGYHGVGKTTVVEQIAQARGSRLVVIRLGQLSDAGDLIGLADFVRNDAGRAINTVFAAPEFLNGSEEQETILFFDEVNRSHKDLIQAIFQAVETGSQLGPHKLVNTKVIAAMNPPNGDYSVLDLTDPAFSDRFCHINFEPSKEEFISYAKSTTNGDFISFLQEHKNMIEQDLAPLSYADIKPSRRSAIRFQSLINLGLPESIRFEIGQGMVGSEAAAAFESYVREKPKKIDVEAMLRDFNNVKDLVAQHNMPMLSLASEELMALLALETTIITEHNVAQVNEFLLAIPGDLAIANLFNLIKVENFINDDIVIEGFLNKNDRLLNLVKQQKAAGVVEKVQSSLTEESK
jgi:hypothetical protein